jgi:F-type H+-transporting ATPase subunit gamma
MPSLKSIRKRIVSVKATQKITRAMKMVAGARLARAQARITALRPYAVKTQEVLSGIAGSHAAAMADGDEAAALAPIASHPYLVVRPEKTVLFLVITADRGLCGALNANVNKAAERAWRERTAAGQDVRIYTVGRKGREYLKRRGAPVVHEFAGVWERLDVEKARLVAKTVIAPLVKGEVDAIYLVYNEFKSAMTQKVVLEPLLPVARSAGASESAAPPPADAREYIYEPNKVALLERLVPMYVEISILRALLESQASFFGAQMTAMDAATKNAKEMIGSLTLQYNRARQAAITKELMEIIGGAEALKE